MEGDLQVPEGVYRINRFNPNSQYHLSLGLNYPNKSDIIRGNKKRPGSDIFIHGKCVTVGCLPMTDEVIEEIYRVAEKSKTLSNKSIYVHIFPCRMRKDYISRFGLNAKWTPFWNELQPIYEYFEVNHEIPFVLIDEDGAYRIKK